MSDRIDLSIVIVSYNVRELLAQCLDAVVREQNSLSTEIFVVDNASADGSAAMVRERFPNVCLIENKENKGFAAANNIAFQRTRGRYALILNPDTAVRPGALDLLVRFMDSHPHAGACGGKLLYGDGSFQHSAFGFPTLAQIALDFFPVNWRLVESRMNGRYPRGRYERGEPFPVDHLLGADLMVRREAAENVGWLDDEYFIYCEEIDWCMRIRKAGWEIWCVPDAEIVHYEGRSTRQFRDRMFVELWRARLYLFGKHYSMPFQAAARQLIRAGLWNEARKARGELRAGKVTQEDLERKLSAFAEVASLLKNRPQAEERR